MAADRLPLGFAAVVLVLIAATAVWSVVVDTRDASRMPAADVVTAGNVALVAEFREGDAIRPYPQWFADARLGLASRPILMGQSIDTWDLYRYQRVFQAFATSHADLADADADALGLSDLERVFAHPKYEVRVGELPAPDRPVVWDGVDAIGEALVSQRPADGSAERLCTSRVRDEWHCGRYNEYIYVSASMQEMGDQNPHRCIIANAPEADASWVVRWPDLPANGATLRWRAGNTFMATRSDRGQAVEFRVVVDGEVAHSRYYDIHDLFYEGQEFTLPDAPTADVSFELHTPDHFDRFFCFRPQVVQ